MHLTLAFIGHRPLDDIEPASEAIRDSAPAAAPQLALAEALWLSPRRPHVLTVALDDESGALAELQAAVVEALADAIGFEPERRAFRPHVTVARVRRGAPPRTDGLRPAPQASFAGEALTLYRSYLGGRPVRYEVVSGSPSASRRSDCRRRCRPRVVADSAQVRREPVWRRRRRPPYG